MVWLRQDLAASDKQCTLLYWHHPRWSSGLAGGSASVWTFWRTAAEFGVEIVVNGHDHHYECFAPQDGEGQPDPTGVRQFVAGTGGTHMRALNEIKPNSEIRYNETNGILKFNLPPGRFPGNLYPSRAILRTAAQAPAINLPVLFGPCTAITPFA